MKTWQISVSEPKTYIFLKIAKVEAYYFTVGANGDLLFFRRGLVGEEFFVLHTAFASGQWSRVEEVEEKDK